MKARVSLLHKTEASWSKLPGFIPEAGELVVYDPDNNFNYARIKMGDGKTLLSDLPFFINSATMAALNTIKYSEVIDGGRITENNK